MHAVQLPVSSVNLITAGDGLNSLRTHLHLIEWHSLPLSFLHLLSTLSDSREIISKLKNLQHRTILTAHNIAA